MKKGWEMKRLGDVATFVNGYPFNPNEWSESGRQIIRIQNLNNENAPYNYFLGEVPNKYLVKSGDILISWSASLGVFEWTGDDSYLNQHIFKVLFDKAPINKKYFRYLVSIKIQEMEKLVHGSTMKHITKSNFDRIPICLHEISYQEQIVKELDTLNTIITKKKQQLEKLDKLAQATFYEMFGDLKRNDKSWTFYFLKDVCSDIVDCPHSTPTKAQTPTIYPCIRTSELKKGQIVWKSMQYVTESEYNKRVARLKPRKGDIVYGREGSYGDAVCLPGGFNFCLGQRTMLFRPNSKIIDIFLLYALLTDFVYNQAKIKNSGSTVGHVNVTDVKMFKIPLPPIEIQQKFVEYMNSIESQKSLIQQSLTDTQQLFDYTMNKYFGS